jgi:hypothetical protein
MSATGSQGLSSSDDDFVDLKSEGTEEEGEEEDEDDVEVGPEVVSLMDDKVFPEALAMLEYCKQQHGLDFLGTRDRLRLDFHGTVKLTNFSTYLVGSLCIARR